MNILEMPINYQQFFLIFDFTAICEAALRPDRHPQSVFALRRELLTANREPFLLDPPASILK